MANKITTEIFIERARKMHGVILPHDLHIEHKAKTELR